MESPTQLNPTSLDVLKKQRQDLYGSVKAMAEFIADSPRFMLLPPDRQSWYRDLRDMGIQSLIMLHSRIEGDNSRRDDFRDLIRPMEREHQG